MKEDITIIYQHYIPETIISDFKKLEIEKAFEMDIVSTKEEQEFYNFTGFEIADIILYFQQHATNIIVDGIIVNTIYDSLKSGIKYLITKLSQTSVKKISGGEVSEKEKTLSLKLENENRVIDILFKGELNEHTDKIIEKAFEFIQSKEVDKTFENPNLVYQRTEKPKIVLKYNSESGIWEPENMEAYRKDMENYMDYLRETLED